MTGTETQNSVLRRVAVLAVSGIVVSLAGRASCTTFEKAINPNYSYTQDVQQTSDGGYVVWATFSSTTYVALIAKLDSSGNFQWQKQYQSSIGGSQVYALKQTLDGGYVWAGELQNSNGSDCAIVVKLDSSRNIQWQKAYGNPNYAASFQKVGLTTDGGLVAGGYTLEFNNQNEAYIVKTDSSGRVNNCSDVQGTTATTASLSDAASGAKLSISSPTNVASSGKVSASVTLFTLATECSGN